MLVKYSPWRDGEQAWGIKIEEGRFADTVLSINEISMPEQGNDIAVDFNFLTFPKDTQPEGVDKSDFDAILAPIIEDIIHKAIQHYQEHEARDPDTQ